MTTDLAVASGQPAIELLLSRASALKLTEPGPSATQIETMLRAAVTAADHGLVRPWRFVVIQGEGRRRLGDLLAEVQGSIKPEASDEDLEKARGKALRAPLVIAVVCQPDPSHKTPVLEQQYAAAAAGAQLMLAAKALGYGSNWKTGAAAEHPVMREGLGLGACDTIIGFFYIGSEPHVSPVPRATTEAVVRYWNER